MLLDLKSFTVSTPFQKLTLDETTAVLHNDQFHGQRQVYNKNGPPPKKKRNSVDLGLRSPVIQHHFKRKVLPLENRTTRRLRFQFSSKPVLV